jgi:hypothetical protein
MSKAPLLTVRNRSDASNRAPTSTDVSSGSESSQFSSARVGRPGARTGTEEEEGSCR